MFLLILLLFSIFTAFENCHASNIPSDLLCPPGHDVIVGFYGAASTFIDRLGAFCAKPKNLTSIISSDVYLGESDGGKAFQFLCPGNSYVASVTGCFSPPYTSGMRFVCVDVQSKNITMVKFTQEHFYLNRTILCSIDLSCTNFSYGLSFANNVPPFVLATPSDLEEILCLPRIPEYEVALQTFVLFLIILVVFFVYCSPKFLSFCRFLKFYIYEMDCFERLNRHSPLPREQGLGEETGYELRNTS